MILYNYCLRENNVENSHFLISITSFTFDTMNALIKIDTMILNDYCTVSEKIMKTVIFFISIALLTFNTVIA